MQAYIKKAAFILKYQGLGGLLKRTYYFLKRKIKKESQQYPKWIKKNEYSGPQLLAQVKESKVLPKKPLLSILTATFNVSPKLFKETYDSVLGQTYPFWEWCIADASQSETKKFVRSLAVTDKRIKFKSLEKNLGIARNINEAAEMSQGDYVLFLDHDDLLCPFALFEVAKAINQEATDFIYSDEDKLGFNGNRVEPFFKPDWSPHLLESFNYINHLTGISRELFERVEGFRSGFEGAQDYDLNLRVTKIAKKVFHIPKILYSWRKTSGSTASGFFEKGYAQKSGKKALESYLSQNKLEGQVDETPYPGIYRLRRKLLKAPPVSIIILTQDKKDYLEKCINSVLESNYKNLEIIVVNNQSKEPTTLDYLKKLSKDKSIKILNYEKTFNFSAINNFAVARTSNPYILFLNNDTQIITSDWLESMLEIAQEQNVGVVAPKLLFPNQSVQNYGVVIGLGGIAGSVFQGYPKEYPGYFGNLVSIRDVSAVSAAAMLVKREIFEKVGGFDENLKVAFNDIDLCLKVRDKGFYVAVTPYAEAYHHESATRGHEYSGDKIKEFKQEIDYFGKKWKGVLEKGDPFYNRNLSLRYTDHRINYE